MKKQVDKGNDANTMRLAKAMSQRKMCSRREADDYILKGWVRVNGEIVKQKGFPVKDYDEIELSKEALKDMEQKVTIIINKPIGYVSGQAEKGYKPAVALVNAKNQWQKDNIRFFPQHLKGLAVAGRLDIDSKGLLVLTSDGNIARHLIGNINKVEKEYLVRVSGTIIENGLALLNHGLSLDGEKLKPAEVKWLNDNQLHFILRQGKKRQIRRMCQLVGLKVTGLKRVRIGKVQLANLPEGKWRFLRKEETF